MKTLILMRHAKSSWDHPSLQDLERPLNARGERDAPLMGSHFSAWGLHPDLLVSSPAVRAQQTAVRVAKALGYPEETVRIAPALYEQGVAGILSVIHAFPESTQSVCLFGHNPDISEAVGLLGGEPVTHLPTGALVSIIFAVDDWAAVMPGGGRINRFEYPKRYIRN